MKLLNFEIENIKSISNSGKCHLSSDSITILAGQNESGKSAVLEALEFLGNGMGDNFQDIIPQDSNAQVEATFELTKEDKKFITEKDTLLGAACDSLNTITITRVYEQGEDGSYICMDYDSTEAIEKAFATAPLSNQLLAELKESLPEAEAASLGTGDLSGIVSRKIELFEELLEELMPQFVLYKSWNNLLPSTLNISEINSNDAIKDFEIITGANFKELSEKNDRTCFGGLSKAQDKIKVDFNKFWTQGDDNNVEYTITPQIKDGKLNFFIIRPDENEPFYPNQRSLGFQWFLSFYLKLRAHTAKSHSKGMVILIDEPGTYLHSTALKNVKDVLQELAERTDISIIYSTHNHELIDVDEHFNRIRLIHRPSKEIGTLISTPKQFSTYYKNADKDTLSPLRIAMGLSPIVFDGKKQSIITEGISDKFYFDAFSLLLGYEDKYSFIGASGITQVPHIFHILYAWGHMPKILIDKYAKQSDKNLIEAIKDGYGLYDNDLKVLNAEGIEDMFSPKFYEANILKGEYKGANNSSKAKDKAKKELDSRIFHESVKTGEIKLADIDTDTKKNFEDVFKWLESSTKTEDNQPKLKAVK